MEMSAPSCSGSRKTLKAKRPVAHVPRGITEAQSAAGESMPLSRKRPATAGSQLVPAPSNGVNVRQSASHLQVVVNGSVPAFTQPLRSRTMSQPEWAPPSTTEPETTGPQTTAVQGSSSGVVRQASRSSMSQSMRSSSSAYHHATASQQAMAVVDQCGIIATRQHVRAGATSQSVRSVSAATATHSSTPPSNGTRRYSVSFVRQPPRSANGQAASTTMIYQHSTASHLTVVDSGCVNANNMTVRTLSQSSATDNRATAASSLTIIDSGASPAFNKPSASVASYGASSQPSTTSSYVPYSHSYGSSQTRTTQVPFGTSIASPQFTQGHTNLSPEIANLGIGLAAEPRKSYGWAKVSTTTGEHVTLFDEVLSLKIEDMALLYLDGMGPFDKREFDKYALPYSPPSQLLKTPTSIKAKTSVVRRPLGDIKNRQNGTSTNGTVVKPQRRSMEMMPPPAKCTRLVRT